MATGKPGSEIRPVFAPTGNQVRVTEDKNKVVVKEAEKAKKVVLSSPSKASSTTCDSSSDSSSHSSSASGKNVNSAVSRVAANRNRNGVKKPGRVVPDGVESVSRSPSVQLLTKRCDWITPNSEQLHISFHDHEWGVSVHDDTKLFELLVFSQALAELTWPVILSKRAIFRKLFDNFEPSSVACMEEERLLSVRVNGNTILSEPKLRAIVENAKQILKIQQEFGTFSDYCWRYVNHKPLKSGFRHGRQVPAKTPKSELISKDLIRRGFHCVGPTIVYSFMQVAGLVNDHLVTCFRYYECSRVTSEEKPTSHLDQTEVVSGDAGETTCSSDESACK